MKFAVAFVWSLALTSGPAWAAGSTGGVIVESTTDEGVIVESTTPENYLLRRPGARPKPDHQTAAPPSDLGWWTSWERLVAEILQLLLR